MPRHIRLTITALVLIAGGPARALEGPDDGWETAANSRVRLNWCGTNMAAAGAGSQAMAFLEIKLDPGWKTYWRMPGDAGVSPTFDWAGSVNIAKATASYPAPHRMADQGGEAVGYKDAVIFPFWIEPRNPELPVPAVLTANYGICKNICVPVEITLTGACYGTSPATAAAVEAVPRRPGEARASDPKLVAVGGSVVAPAPRLTFEVDFGAAAIETDLFIEAPEGLYVPLPARAVPDAQGHARFTVDLSKSIDAKDLLGKQLRLTMVSAKGTAEALWIAK